MRWMKWLVLAIAIAYFLFYLGGSYSFAYTHACADRHKKTVFHATHDNAVPQTIIVCDAYSANSKHWSPGDPVRALYSVRLTKYNGMIVVGIVLVVAAAVFFERRKRSRSQPAG